MKTLFYSALFAMSLLSTAHAEPVMEMRQACEILKTGYSKEYRDSIDELKPQIAPLVTEQVKLLKDLASQFSDSDKKAVREFLKADALFRLDPRLSPGQVTTVTSDLKGLLDKSIGYEEKLRKTAATRMRTQCFGNGKIYDGFDLNISDGYQVRHQAPHGCGHVPIYQPDPNPDLIARHLSLALNEGAFTAKACTLDLHFVGRLQRPIRTCSEMDLLTGEISGDNLPSALRTGKPRSFYRDYFNVKSDRAETMDRVSFTTSEKEFVDKKLSSGAEFCLHPEPGRDVETQSDGGIKYAPLWPEETIKSVYRPSKKQIEE